MNTEDIKKCAAKAQVAELQSNGFDVDNTHVDIIGNDVFIGEHSIKPYLKGRKVPKKVVTELGLTEKQMAKIVEAARIKLAEITALAKEAAAPKVLTESIYYAQSGNQFYPQHDVIAKMFIQDFSIVDAYTDGNPGDMALWMMTQNGYAIMGKTNEFLLKHLVQKLLEENPQFSTIVDEQWIKRPAITNFTETKKIIKAGHGKFPMKNGMLDIQTGTILPEDGDKITIVKSEVEFDSEATCPKFLAWLDEVFMGDQNKIEALKYILAAIMAGCDPQVIAFLVSRGRSGKSVLLRIITELFGSMVTSLKPDRIHDRFTNWGFLHRRLCIDEEVGGKLADLNCLKSLSGGQQLTFEVKNQQHMLTDFTQCAVFQVTNSPPPLESGPAAEGRQVWLEFPLSFVENPKADYERPLIRGIEQDLLLELPGIVNHLLPYAQWCLANPKDMFKVKIPYERTADKQDRATNSMDYFLEECCEQPPMGVNRFGQLEMKTDDTYKVSQKTFNRLYTEFCLSPDVNTSAPAAKYIRKALRDNYGIKAHSGYYMGVRIKPISRGRVPSR